MPIVYCSNIYLHCKTLSSTKTLPPTTLTHGFTENTRHLCLWSINLPFFSLILTLACSLLYGDGRWVSQLLIIVTSERAGRLATMKAWGFNVEMREQPLTQRQPVGHEQRYWNLNCIQADSVIFPWGCKCKFISILTYQLSDGPATNLSAMCVPSPQIDFQSISPKHWLS